MFDLTDTKIFMDVVHGYISIPKIFVEYIVDTPWFQRLRYVDQTGMKVLYPNGKHDRFCHSLGVYCLGLKAVDTLLEHFRNQVHWNIRSDNTCDVFWAKNKVLFLIACLLHDIGHAPFSHSLESVILENSDGVNKRLINYINDLEKTDNEKVRFLDLKAAAHERLGSLVIIEHFRNNIAEILKDLQKKNYPNENAKTYAEYAQPSPSVTPEELDGDMAFIVRMIMGLKYREFRPESQIRNCFIELLNGNGFDVDKLDYIIRDTKMSGISNIALDVERLIGALTLVTTTEYRKFSFDPKGGYGFIGNKDFIKRLETDNGQKLELDGFIDGVFSLKPGSKISIFPGNSFLSLKAAKDPSGENETISKIELLSSVDFDGNTLLFVDGGEEPKKCNTKDGKRIVWAETESLHTVIIKNATTMEEHFEFKVTGLMNLEIKGNCRLTIEGEMSMNSAWFKGQLAGDCSKLTIVNDYLKQQDRIPTSNEYNGYSIGYKKQAINLISNVLDARNYLYMWIYAHHKVVYYSNFLIPVLADTLRRITDGKDRFFPSWKLNYDDIGKLDDSYFMTAIRFISDFYKEELTSREQTLIDEFFCRIYKKSLYKSMAEYDIMFSDFTMAQRQNIRVHLSDITDSECVLNEKVANGFFRKESIDNIKETTGENIDFVEDLVWVAASYKYKSSDHEDTYCVFPNQTVTMGKIDLLSNPTQNKQTNHYFYLYYQVKDGKKDDSETLKRAIQKYFQKYFENRDCKQSV